MTVVVSHPEGNNDTMKFDFAQCRRILHRSLMAALEKNQKRICELNKTEPIWAISYDIIPWDPYVGIAFRLESESDDRENSMSSGGWMNSHFIEDITEPALHPARDYVEELCKSNSSQEVPHLIYLAAADALLDKKVAALLQSNGVAATVWGNRLSRGGCFSYIVTDEDRVLKADYCEIVIANRITRRLLGRVTK